MSNEIKYVPEQWLLLSPLVDQTVRNHPRDPDGLLQLRLDDGLVRELDDISRLKGEVAGLIARGWRTIHLVFQSVDEKALAQVQPLVTSDDIDIQIHSWNRSPSEVSMSLTAPDLAIVDALQSGGDEALGTTLVLADKPKLPHGFRDRLIEALRGWETAAREQFGEDFDEFYPVRKNSPIDWESLIVIPSPPPPRPTAWGVGIVRDLRRAAANAAQAIGAALLGGRTLHADPDKTGRVTRLDAAPFGGSTLHADAAPAGSTPLVLTDEAQPLQVELHFVDGPSPAVRWHLRWTGEGDAPARLRLHYPSVPYELMLDCGRWIPSLEGAGSVATVVLPDPHSALRSLLSHLQATRSELTVEMLDGDAAEP